MSNKQIFEPVNREVATDIKQELRAQGHYLTGALEASLNDREIDENGNIVLTAEALGYIEDLEKGVPAENIVYNAQSLAEMTRYVELRMGYRGSKAVRVANLIIRKHMQEGNPTQNSYNYSKTGSRTEAIKETFDNNKQKYIGMLDDAAYGDLDNSFHQVKSGTI